MSTFVESIKERIINDEEYVFIFVLLNGDILEIWGREITFHEDYFEYNSVDAEIKTSPSAFEKGECAPRYVKIPYNSIFLRFLLTSG